MPQYEYKCECGEQFELLRPMRQAGEDAPCPSCSKSARRIMSLLSKSLVARTFTTYGHDGEILGRKQTTEKTPPPGYRYKNPNIVEV
ncbi:hypothetical protein LCGC14_1905310 [marine sediment metagenome]|uniref:Putative regulatory protein FmdB zinc ribbon domain-containing protein n=1 Tax=marine sediment metagenome TaxID=412755 RepID=A0A0F9ITH0_9ZZZZ